MTIRECQVLYDQLRKRYFLDADGALHIPPPASELRWGWLSSVGPESDALAITKWDEDGEPDELYLSAKDARRTIIRTSLLHELTHMRLGPDVSCGRWHQSPTGGGKTVVPYGSAWQKEAVRLASLGALHL